MSLFEYLIVAIAFLILLACAYIVRSQRIIGNKVSSVHQAVKKSEQKLGSQIQELLGEINSVKARTEFQGSKELAKAKYVLSFTTYPARFGALEDLIPSITNQILKPTEIHLNLTTGDFAKLPASMKSQLKSAKVKIFEVSDLGPGKKLIPTLQRTKLPIITIDDDLLLPNDLTLQLMAEHLKHPSDIIAARTHLIAIDDSGAIKKFAEWQLEFDRYNSPDPRLLPTSGAGTLFPSGSLHQEVLDQKSYRDLAFHTDDLWWYFHARKAGTAIRRLPGRRPLSFIEGTQEVGLWSTGNQERNDQNFAKLVARYGNPLVKSKLR